MSQPEICICAAIRLDDGRIIRGHRHNDCLRTLWEMKPPIGRERPEQGFITSRNRFVGREEAMDLQLAAGVPSAAKDGGYRGNTLFSEDLY